MLTLSVRGTYLRAVSICTKWAVRAVRQVTCPVSQATGLRGPENLGTGRQAACLVFSFSLQHIYHHHRC